ncbi:MAG: hypothetical protein FWD13_06495 [Treponema sp.]|nr:hypothetical protein [Treponema sp.]
MKKTIKILGIIVILTIIGFAISCSGDDDPPLTNIPPVANPGTDFEHNISTQGTSIILNGSGTDEDGYVVSYDWVCTSTPSGSSFTFNSAVQNPTVSGFDKLGEYEFTLKVKDNEDAESVGAAVKVTLVRTANAEITISERVFTPGEELNFSVEYGDIDPIFAGRLTYKINDGTSDIVDTAIDTGFDGKVVTIGAYDTKMITFTQTFYFDGIKIMPEKSNSLTAYIVGPSFMAFIENDSPVMEVTTPELAISLSEKVTEGNID